MKLNPEELRKAVDVTLGHYNQHAEAFWEGTRDHDVSQNVETFLHAFKAPPPCNILDVGCGPGRDLITFSKRGHKAIGLDGAQHFAEMAHANSGCEVWHQDFLALDLPQNYFDGVFANASLFHIPSQELPDVLAKLNATLKAEGILFSSNPRGPNKEGWVADRYGTYHDLDAWRAYMAAAGFTELAHYYRPEGVPREQQPWLASLWRKL